ncbi:CWC16 protein [Xylaria castorea]|nr:CWC16 protein [Xylaria castorea]
MQGFNMGRYVPPDVEGTISGNALNKKHALGARASKLRTEGILTVRFEIPFGVWCGTCPKPTIIGQGVRFNAEKKKVGTYHSTPIWSFRMRHTDCGGAIEIRTDPANAEYVVTEGGTRRDTGDDKDDSLVTSRDLIGGLGEIQTAKEKDALRNDAFARLEKTIEDRGVLIERTHRIAELEDVSYRAWEDPYAQNRRLRAAFRTGRKTREKEAASTEELQERMSLGIDLVPATEEDARRAALVDFGVAAALITFDKDDDDTEERETDAARKARIIRDAALTKPLFATTSVARSTSTTAAKTDDAPKPGEGSKKRLKAEVKASQTRESLASTVTRNTRASQDPFLLLSSASVSESRGGGGGEGGGIPKSSRIQGIKRKRTADVHTESTPTPLSTLTTTTTYSPNQQQPKKGTEPEKIKGGQIESNLRKESPHSTTLPLPDDTAKPPDTRPPPKTALVEYDDSD